MTVFDTNKIISIIEVSIRIHANRRQAISCTHVDCNCLQVQATEYLLGFMGCYFFFYLNISKSIQLSCAAHKSENQNQISCEWLVHR